MKLLNSCESLITVRKVNALNWASNLWQAWEDLFVSGIFLALLFLGALFWAKAQDPFSRKWFTLKAKDGTTFKCVTVLSKPFQLRPIIIYAHGSGGSLMNDGFELRQMAELGLAVVSLEYSQSNVVAFSDQFNALLQYIARQKWADTNDIAWVGFSLGANRMLDYALQHPEQSPHLLVLLGGKGMDQSATKNQPSTFPPLLLIHGEQDEIFSAADTKRLAAFLQSNGVPVNLKIISGASHGLGADRGTVFRGIGEYCRTHFASKTESVEQKSEISLVTSAAAGKVWQNYHSITQWQAEAPSFWLFWLPAAVWIIGWLVWWRYHKPASSEKIKMKRHEVALRWVAALLATWALAETAIHLVMPRFPVSDTTLSIARKFLVQPKETADFETLAAQQVWHGEKLKTLLDHVTLSGYNRELINWQLNDKIYQDYVLSPAIELSTLNSQLSTSLNWRRSLWEEFYPRTRHESSPEDAAKIVVRHLRERVTIATLPNPLREVPDIWLKQITDLAGFEIIYVAALRSVGVPARLDASKQAEFWNGINWSKAPNPLVMELIEKEKRFKRAKQGFPLHF